MTKKPLKLKPCPACGEDATYNDAGGSSFVICDNVFCQMEGPIELKENPGLYWNSLPPQKEACLTNQEVK